jgi:hypothetical protein
MNDFKQQFLRQLRFLENSCKLYDEGQIDEAIRIAVSLRVLFHDTKSSTSLLTHLGQKQSWILSTAELASTPQQMDVPLVRVQIKANAFPVGGCECLATPMLGESSRNQHVHSKTWWAEEKIIRCGSGAQLTRSDLIRHAANKDGGAHVDKEYEPVYQQILDGAGLSVEILYKNGERVSAPFAHLHFACLRQMAYEVLNSKDILRIKQQSQ